MGKKLKNAKKTITYLSIVLCAVVLLSCLYFISGGSKVLGNGDTTCYAYTKIGESSCRISSCGARDTSTRSRTCNGTKNTYYSEKSWTCWRHHHWARPKAVSTTITTSCQTVETDFVSPTATGGIE